MRRFAQVGVLIVLVVGAGAYYFVHARPATLVLTGIVTTNDVIVSPQIGGQITRVLVKEGDAVKRDQLVAVIAPDELRADSAYYAQAAAGAGSAVEGNLSAVRYQERQTENQV